MPTFARLDREFWRVSRDLQHAFLAVLPSFVDALRAAPPAFPPSLRIKRVQGVDGVWEITFAPDGRATFEYGPQVRPDEPHVIWRRIGGHGVLSDP